MPTKITINNNGNIRVEGDFEINERHLLFLHSSFALIMQKQPPHPDGDCAAFDKHGDICRVHRQHF